MQPTTNIETALLRHQEKNHLENYFTRFIALKEELLNNIYPHVMVGFPGGNDHGPNHIIRVLEYLDKIIGIDGIAELDIYELFIAMMSVLWHDVGIERGRKDHAEKSAVILANDGNDYIFKQEDKEYIKLAVVSHSSSIDIETKCKPFRASEPVRGHTMRIRLVCALVRLADEIDEDARRAEKTLARMADLPDDSKFYWRFNQRIPGVLPEPQKRQIVFSIRFQPEDIGWYEIIQGQRILFIEAFLGKIIKINQERTKCSHLLPDKLKYEQILLSISPVTGHTARESPIQLVIDDNSTLETLLNQIDHSLRRPWPNTKSVTKIERLISAGHTYLSSLPGSPLDGTLSMREMALAIERELHIKVEVAIIAQRKLVMWIRPQEHTAKAIRALAIGVTGLVAAREDCDIVEIGFSETRDLIHKAEAKQVGFANISLDRREVLHIVKYHELPEDFLKLLKVRIFAAENTIDVHSQDVPFLEFN